ncbi:MAG: ribosome small subunit-dependent GTPase A [Clostridiaceae bacterium]|nr:ribosome small subunit-dependent GTPase A [Clostridiaceae bacterium]
MQKGVIVKGIGGFYYVDTGEGIYECRARGKFRIKDITPLIGDHVEIEVDAGSLQGYIINILERKNQLKRPTVANIDQVIIVFAARSPDINMALMQKFLVYSEYKDIDVTVCINKIDLDPEGHYLDVIKMLESIPYKVISTSAKLNIGIEQLEEVLKDKISVFAGPSGAGKSSLLNCIQPGLELKTGDLSKKIDRGTHTTRHAELIKLKKVGMVADTPGFTSLDIGELESSKLENYFPEFGSHRDCYFLNCMHDKEPRCGIKEAVSAGKINRIRYDFYISLLNELKSGGRTYK